MLGRVPSFVFWRKTTTFRFNQQRLNETNIIIKYKIHLLKDSINAMTDLMDEHDVGDKQTPYGVTTVLEMGLVETRGLIYNRCVRTKRG
jgi:hypothetical protein